jgi:predicted component of type VI protein secretion system
MGEMDRLPVLVATGGPLLGRRFEVTPRGLILGREDSCDVAIADPNVSRQHARVLLHNGAVWVQDAGSRNGVFVNDKRLARPKQIGTSDRLTVGGQAFRIELQAPADDADAPPPPVPGTAADAPSGPSLAVGLVLGVAVALAAILAFTRFVS